MLWKGLQYTEIQSGVLTAHSSAARMQFRCWLMSMPTGSQGNKSWPPTSGVLAGAFNNSQVTGQFLPRNKGFPVPMVCAPRSSELSKLVANAMLAQRVSSINSISRRGSAIGLGKGTPMVFGGVQHLWGYRKSNHNPTNWLFKLVVCIQYWHRGDQYVSYVRGIQTCLNRSRWCCWHSCPWLWSEAVFDMGK